MKIRLPYPRLRWDQGLRRLCKQGTFIRTLQQVYLYCQNIITSTIAFINTSVAVSFKVYVAAAVNISQQQPPPSSQVAISISANSVILPSPLFFE